MSKKKHSFIDNLYKNKNTFDYAQLLNTADYLQIPFLQHYLSSHIAQQCDKIGLCSLEQQNQALLDLQKVLKPGLFDTITSHMQTLSYTFKEVPSDSNRTYLYDKNFVSPSGQAICIYENWKNKITLQSSGQCIYNESGNTNFFSRDCIFSPYDNYVLYVDKVLFDDPRKSDKVVNCKLIDLNEPTKQQTLIDITWNKDQKTPCFNDNGTKLLVKSRWGDYNLIDTSTGKIIGEVSKSANTNEIKKVFFGAGDKICVEKYYNFDVFTQIQLLDINNNFSATTYTKILDHKFNKKRNMLVYHPRNENETSTITIHNLETNKSEDIILKEKLCLVSVTFNPQNDNFLILGKNIKTENWELLLYDPVNKTFDHLFSNEYAPRRLKWSRSGQYIIVQTKYDDYIQYIDIHNKNELVTIEAPDNITMNIHPLYDILYLFHHDGKNNRQLIIYNFYTKKSFTYTYNYICGDMNNEKNLLFIENEKTTDLVNVMTGSIIKSWENKENESMGFCNNHIHFFKKGYKEWVLQKRFKISPCVE
jgi:hypothetical protein